MSNLLKTKRSKTSKPMSWKRYQEMLSNIRKAEAEHGNAQYDFLENSGWEYSSDNPSCCWFWQKKLTNGRVFLCRQDDAVRVEEALATEEAP